MKLGLKFFILNVFVLSNAMSELETEANVFDLDLYDDVLDSDQCRKQISYIKRNSTILLMQFADASFRTPRRIFKGNTRDLGNYFECLDISKDVQNMHIRGKYCLVQFPLNQEDFLLPNTLLHRNSKTPYVESLLTLPWEEYNAKSNMLKRMNSYERSKPGQQISYDSNYAARSTGGILADLDLELAICIPEVCTPGQALDFFTNNLTSKLTYTELFCRLPNDKSWSKADTIATSTLSIIGLITLLSTAYDVCHTLILERNPDKANKIWQSLSVYSNTKNFFIFPTDDSVVTCLDGIRSFAMAWIIIGHTFSSQIYLLENVFDFYDAIPKFTSLWITSGDIAVDTFFLMSGLLVVYTTAAKESRSSLFKTLHLFYLNRLLRMFPVLAFAMLMTASFLHRLADGPYFLSVADLVNSCRVNWWSNLLYLQNFIHPSTMCLPHVWYLAVDMQLHFFAPVVLYWVLGRRKLIAWLAMTATLVGFLAAAAVYNFMNNFPFSDIELSRLNDEQIYIDRYYIHTLPRAAPFFVGMMYGYLFHIYRKKKLIIRSVVVWILWVIAFAGSTGMFVVTYWVVQPDWDNQLMNNILNTFRRPIWAACVGWMAFACHTGYGGPINWFLSLHVFKILSRLSYAMYILHYPLVDLVYATSLTPLYFSLHFSMFQFLIHFSLALIAAFIVTITIESPFAKLVRIYMRTGAQKRPIANSAQSKVRKFEENPTLINNVPKFKCFNVIENDKKISL